MLANYECTVYKCGPETNRDISEIQGKLNEKEIHKCCFKKRKNNHCHMKTRTRWIFQACVMKTPEAKCSVSNKQGQERK